MSDADAVATAASTGMTAHDNPTTTTATTSDNNNNNNNKKKNNDRTATTTLLVSPAPVCDVEDVAWTLVSLVDVQSGQGFEMDDGSVKDQEMGVDRSRMGRGRKRRGGGGGA